MYYTLYTMTTTLELFEVSLSLVQVVAQQVHLGDAFLASEVDDKVTSNVLQYHISYAPWHVTIAVVCRI